MTSLAKQRANDTRTKIVALLSDEKFVSGEAISRTLHITRSSVCNHIKALNDLGLDIFSVKGRGYKLSQALSMLDRDLIVARISNKKDAQIVVHNIVGSTNDLMKERLAADNFGDTQGQAQLSQGSTILAEAQTQGRGRRGRKWVSPFGASLYLTMLWRFDSGYQAMSGLSLLIGIGLKRALIQLGLPECKLKWPNDVYFDNKKLAGILVEVEGQLGEASDAIIGIGVNVNLPEGVQDIDQAFTDLSSISKSTNLVLDRNHIAATLIEELWRILPLFEQEGLSAFLDEWKEADLFADRNVNLVSGRFTTAGIARGIDESGALLLEVDGTVKAYYGGEISVRPA
ncbi:bifunctional biotin--[acetyl-CoA-carboxylase] ligase/biotin operon repressor BirA [Ningiella sp. W23]|uniref:bifunctional biotin--[acetyl-CoA-carboxylase] ligase/biotin operon repressor BirA n=1 Tax=Ningiella sp. W23 TaxID=3023715 RepID=UPI003756DEE1